ncbi:branched-chain amino acid ABC transporter substrate-binding protein [Nitratireductor thuwali]|uniref:Leu/Ile/Val-binding protein n=1 Tax=Nitratireductor thuwali TaxID=2267699 RepID=A0ABY5MN68_9HYPH|nr:Leu/Ile/Val-binding protein [Nitratireductor thuwali]
MRFAAILILFASLWAGLPARADGLAVGIAAPLSEDFERLGRQWVAGAEAAAETLPGSDISLYIVDDACSEEGGERAGRSLVEADVSIVIGFLCTPAVEAAMPILAQAGIPVITPVRTNSLTDQRARTGWPIYRLAPRADAEQDAVAQILTARWREKLFAIVDDGTIYGRELAEHLRAEAELAGLEPVFFDTFRPQMDNQIGLVGRLRRAGATHVFVGGDRADIAIMARDAASLGYDLTIAGGEALRAEDGNVKLPEGVLMVGLPEWREFAPERTLEFLADRNIEAEGYVLPGFAALQVAAGAAKRAAETEVSLADALDSYAFDTAIGIVRFDRKGDLARPLYDLFRYDGEEFVKAE